MQSPRTFAFACLVAAQAGCGIDTGIETTALTGAPAPLDPFLSCIWNAQPIPSNRNIGLTGYGYWGDQRGFRIHHGNYVDTNLGFLGGEYLEYKIEVIWSLPGCSGTVYYVRFPDHLLTNHAEIEVRNAAQALLGRVVANEGSLPILYNQANLPLPTNKLGPFVVAPGMVGGANGMADTIAFTLLDAQILTQLPPPVYFNGATPNGVQQGLVDDAYDDLVDANDYLYSFFTFRLALGTMSSADRQATSDSIDIVIDDPGPIHGDPLSDEHHHVDHGVAVAPAAVGGEFGGFFNGHRNLLREVEVRLRGEPTVPGFGRVPAWDPAATIPAEFAIGTANVNGGVDLETQYKAANICANFPSSLSALPTHAERLTDLEFDLFLDVVTWHNSVHNGVGGDFANIGITARLPMFHPWHTSVDVIWQNWQLCEAAYYPNRYSWDAL